jgi:putative tricarboxylic transport membrane protein
VSALLGKDRLCAVFALAIAGFYDLQSRDIQESLLSDAVGADGVPRLLAAVLAGLGILLLVRPVRRDASDDAGMGLRHHLRALGLLAMSALYIALLPTLGYAVSIFLLIAAVAIYGGTPPSLRLFAISAAGGAFLWLSFVKLFGIPMPAGLFATFFG